MHLEQFLLLLTVITSTVADFDGFENNWSDDSEDDEVGIPNHVRPPIVTPPPKITVKPPPPPPPKPLQPQPVHPKPIHPDPQKPLLPVHAVQPQPAPPTPPRHSQPVNVVQVKPPPPPPPPVKPVNSVQVVKSKPEHLKTLQEPEEEEYYYYKECDDDGDCDYYEITDEVIDPEPPSTVPPTEPPEGGYSDEDDGVIGPVAPVRIPFIPISGPKVTVGTILKPGGFNGLKPVMKPKQVQNLPYESWAESPLSMAPKRKTIFSLRKKSKF